MDSVPRARLVLLQHVHYDACAHPDCGDVVKFPSQTDVRTRTDGRTEGLTEGRTDGAMAISAVAAVTSIQITLSEAAFDAALSLYCAAIFSGTWKCCRTRVSVCN